MKTETMNTLSKLMAQAPKNFYRPPLLKKWVISL